MNKLLTVCLLAMVISTGLRAESLEHPDSGLKIDVPKGWAHDTAEDLLVITNPDDDVVMLVLAASDDTAKAFVDHIDKELDHLMKNPKVTKGPTEEKGNGLTQSYIEGTGVLLDTDKWLPKGEKGGENVEWHLTLVTGGKIPLVVIAFGKLADNKKAIDTIYRSIKK
jgi:hypothetical protein